MSATDRTAGEAGETDEFEAAQELLREQQRRDSEDVAAGRRTPQSLWAFEPGSLRGAKVTPNPDSEYEQPGEGW